MHQQQQQQHALAKEQAWRQHQLRKAAASSQAHGPAGVPAGVPDVRQLNSAPAELQQPTAAGIQEPSMALPPFQAVPGQPVADAPNTTACTPSPVPSGTLSFLSALTNSLVRLTTHPNTYFQTFSYLICLNYCLSKYQCLCSHLYVCVYQNLRCVGISAFVCPQKVYSQDQSIAKRFNLILQEQLRSFPAALERSGDTRAVQGSASFLAESSVRSPRKIFIFYYLHKCFLDQSIQKRCYLF